MLFKSKLFHIPHMHILVLCLLLELLFFFPAHEMPFHLFISACVLFISCLIMRTKSNDWKKTGGVLTGLPCLPSLIVEPMPSALF